MSHSAEQIPNLERLLRSTVGELMSALHGPAWDGVLKPKTLTAISKAANTARHQRPNELLTSDWDAAGLNEILAVLNDRWADLTNNLGAVWTSQPEMNVDLERVRGYRGKMLHAVGTPPLANTDAEVAAIVQRVRLGLEAVRRNTRVGQGEWWPYIESIQSNIAAFRRPPEPDASEPGVILIVGDTVEIRIVAVHPDGRQDRLRYDFYVGHSGGVIHDVIGATSYDWSGQMSEAATHAMIEVRAYDVNNRGAAASRQFAFMIQPDGPLSGR